MSLLNDWINPCYLDLSEIDRLKRSITKPNGLRYHILDDFLKINALQTIKHQKVDEAYLWDSPSEAYRRKIDRTKNYDTFLLSPEWGTFLRNISGNSKAKGECYSGTESVLSQNTNGYWIHSDKFAGKIEKQFIALLYVNEGWQKSDGGLLQLWKEIPLDPNLPQYALSDYFTISGRMPLDFLNQSRRLTISEPAHKKSLELCEEILPLENRLVLISLEDDLGFHAVTPTIGSSRRTFSQFFI